MLRESETAFLVTIDPPLVGGDLSVVLARLRANWPPGRLVELLTSPLASVVKTAATCLGLTGTMEHCGPLVSLLGHADEEVAAAAEDALWSIWMRAGSENANRQLKAAVERMRKGRIEAALDLLHDLTAAENPSAEAHHQQAIALHSLERYEEAEAAYQEALALNPYHFAAVAGLGHICGQRRDLTGALRYYRRALRIHPRLKEIREVVPQLEAAIQKRVVA
ncbi:MAG: tetratricopeptide repeat protein [Phycisphaerae bacterium]